MADFEQYSEGYQSLHLRTRSAFAEQHRTASFGVTEMRRVGGLATVGKCALPDGFRATSVTLPKRVIDVAVLVVAGVWGTDTLVVRWERLKGAVSRCDFDARHVLTERAPVNVVRARTSHHVAGHVVQRHDVLVVSRFSWLSMVTSMSPGAWMSKENCSAYARFCAVSSASRAGMFKLKCQNTT